MTKMISRLGAILGLDSKEFVKGVNEAQQKSKEFKKQLRETKQTVDEIKTSFTIAGAAMAAFAVAAIRTADEIADLADANDTTVEKVLELRQALVQSGGDAEKAGQLYSSFSNAIDTAASGNDKLRETFLKLGISARDLGFLTNEELKQKAIEGLSKIEDAATRSAIAQDLFGKAARGVDFKTLVDRLGDANGKYGEQAEAIRKAAEAADKAAKLFSDMQLAALKAIQPIVTLFNKIPDQSRVDALAKAFTLLGEAIFIAFAIRAVAGVKELSKALITLTTKNPFLMAATVAVLAGDALGMFDSLKSKLGSLFDDNSGPAVMPDGPASSTGKGGPRRKVEKTNKELEAEREAKRLAEEIAKKRRETFAESRKIEGINKLNLELIQKEHDTQMTLLELNRQRANFSDEDYESAQKRLEIENELNNLMADFNRQRIELDAELEKADKKDIVFAEKLHDDKMKAALAEYSLKRDLLHLREEAELSAIKSQHELRRRLATEDQQIALQNNLKALELEFTATMQNLELDGKAYALESNRYKLMQLEIAANEQLAQIQEKYNKERQAAQVEFDRSTRFNSDREEFQRKLDNIDKLQEAETSYLQAVKKQQERNAVDEISRQRSWIAGWQNAYKEFSESTERMSETGAAVFQSVISNMDQALANFVRTGKLAFKDLIRSMIQDLLYLQMQMQMNKLLNSLIGSLMGSYLPAKVNPATGGGFIGGGYGSIGVSGHASGGYISGPSLVGENGPELFVPRTEGTIIPNGSWQQMASGMGGGMTVNGPYIANLSTIDSKSFEDRIYESSKAVWSAGKYAEKSLAYNGGRT